MHKLIKFPTAQQIAAKREEKGLIMTYPAQLFFGMTEDSVNRIVSGFQAYAVSALVFTCMKYRATKLVEPPLMVVEENEDGEDWLPDHELNALLEQPNPDMEMYELLEQLSLYMDARGAAILLKSRDNAGRVAALYPFSSDEFSVRPKDGRIYGEFRVRTSKGEESFGPEDVIFFRNVDPRNMFNGMAPLDAALTHVNIGQEQRDAIVAQLKNAIRPGAQVEFPHMLEKDEWETFVERLRAAHAGSRNGGKVITVEGGAKLTLMPSNLKDLALGDVQKDVEAAVCSVFQVHPALIGARIGLENSSSWSDVISSATKLFYDLYAFPIWSRFEKQLTRGLLREMDEDSTHFIKFDKSDVRALAEDMNMRTQEATRAAAYWTVNEQRSHTGQTQLADDDPRGQQLGAEIRGANPFGDLFGNGGGPANKARRFKTVKARKVARVIRASDPKPTDEERKVKWLDFDEKARRQEDVYRSTALALFAQEKTDILALFNAAAKDLNEDAIIDRILQKIAESYGRDAEYHRNWLAKYRALIAKTVKIAGDEVAAQLGFDFDLTNPLVLQAIEERANLLAGNVTDTTYNQIQEQIAAGRAEGLGVRKVAERINETVFGDLADSRSISIARTETVGALNTGEYMSAVTSGVIQSKEWLTQGDDRVRDSHAEIDRDTIPIDAMFDNGLEYPGQQGGDASEVIQCRCTLLYHDEEA